MKKFLLSVLIFSLFFVFNSVSGQVPNLVKDIYVGINQSNSGLVGIDFGTGILLNANDGIAGSELWFSDGSNPGTVLVKDINPGTTGSFPSSFFKLGSKVLFTAIDAVNGMELWITDGTLAGTTLVKDIYPGASSSVPTNFMAFGSKMLFLATTFGEGKELWITDGTTAGTMLVKDIWPGASNSTVVQMTNSGLGYVYFVANDGTAGEELWKTDGTTAGTILLKDILPGTGFSNVSIFKMAGPNLFFAADNGSIGKELWKSDGTVSGTTLVKDFIPGLTSSFAGSLDCIEYNNKLFFGLTEPVNGYELWESDGTTVGTIINNVSTGTVSTIVQSNFYIYGSDLYFFRRTVVGTKDSLRLCKITSSVTNLSVVKKWGGLQNAFIDKFNFVQTNNTKFVAVNTAPCTTSGDLFFVSDGTASGSDFAIGEPMCFSFPYEVKSIPFINNNWIFPMYTGTLVNSTDHELHNIDYTNNAVSLIKTINTSTNNGYYGLAGAWTYKHYFFNSKYYLLANDGSTGRELWVTDGTNGGTNLLLDIYPGMNDGPVSNNGDFTAIVTSNNMFFYANDGFTGRELWAIGTGTSTVNEHKRVFENIFVYPNPATDDLQFNVRSEYFSKNKTEYFIYNSVGQISRQGTLSENKISVSGLADGFYTISLKLEAGDRVLKFVKN